MNCTELSAKDRVEIELSQLDEKITKLDTFIKSEKFKLLNESNQAILKRQLNAMKDYAICLTLRLKEWQDIN